MKKWLFIPVLIILLMSHNTSAVSLNYNLNDYSWKSSLNLSTQYCAYTYNTFNTSPSICALSKSSPNSYGLISSSIEHKKNDLGQFYIAVGSRYNSADIYGNLGLYSDNFGTFDNNFKIIGFDTVSSDNGGFNEITGGWSCSWVQNGEICQSYEDSNQENYYSRIYKVTIIWTTDGSHAVGLRSLNANIPLYTCKFASASGVGAQCQIRLFGYTQWEYSGSSENKEQAEATQEQVDDSESASEDAQDDVNNASSSLLGNITNIVGAIRDTPASDCYINVSTAQFSVGNLNLCQGVPSSILNSIRVLAALVITPMVLRASYVIVRSMIDKFHEVQDT